MIKEWSTTSMKVTIGKKRVDNIIAPYLVVVYALIMSGSVFQYAYMGTLERINVFLTLILFFVYVLRQGRKTTCINKCITDSFVIAGGIGLLVCMTIWHDFSSFWGYLSKFCVILMPWLICKYVDIQDFLNAYIKVILFLAVASLILYLVPFALNLLPYKAVIETSNWSFDYYLVYAAFHNAIYKIHQRNIGIFWEPGMYQGYLIFAMIYVAAAKKRTIKAFLFQVIMSATILTTQSSTGYILLLPALLICALSCIPPERKIMRTLTTMLVIVITIFAFLNPKPIYSLLDALSPGLMDKLLAGNDGGSMGTRVYGMLTDANLALRHPFGIGAAQLEQYRSNMMWAFGFLTDGANINTTFSMLLYYGWIPGVLYHIMIAKGCFRFFGKNLIGLVALIIMLIIINTEPHYMTLFFTVIFMGIESGRNYEVPNQEMCNNLIDGATYHYA